MEVNKNKFFGWWLTLKLTRPSSCHYTRLDLSRNTCRHSFLNFYTCASRSLFYWQISDWINICFTFSNIWTIDTVTNMKRYSLVEVIKRESISRYAVFSVCVYGYFFSRWKISQGFCCRLPVRISAIVEMDEIWKLQWK